MTRRLSLVTLLSACTGAPQAPADPLSALGDLADAERTCLEQACADAITPEALKTCREQKCPHKADTWRLLPKSIRHEGQTIFVRARVEHDPGGYGDVIEVRDTDAYVGCTVVTSTGDEIDLAVTTIFPNMLDAPFTLASEVGPDVRDVIFGVWDRKIEPCDSDRMGCQEYGFLLDGSLATWPPTVYTDGTRQRIPPPVVDVEVRDGGAGVGFIAERDQVVAALSTELALFGAKVGRVRSGLASAHAARTQVAHSDEHDRLLARRVASKLVETPDVSDRVLSHDGLPADFLITVGGDAATWEATRAACVDSVDGEFDRCLKALAGAKE